PDYEALTFSENLITAYPGSKYVTEAREKRPETLEKLAAKEIYIADFYRKRRDHLSALGRYEGVLNKYPESKMVPAALYGASISSAKSDEPVKSERYRKM